MAYEKDAAAPPAAGEASQSKAQVEIRVELDLDNLEEFDLKGDGIKLTHVVSN
jgi:hypothetical protein